MGEDDGCSGPPQFDDSHFVSLLSFSAGTCPLYFCPARCTSDLIARVSDALTFERRCCNRMMTMAHRRVQRDGVESRCFRSWAPPCTLRQDSLPRVI
jgi:hypothetical protein